MAAHVLPLYIKPWLVPWNPAGPPKQDVARWFFEGLPEGRSIPWHLWVRPLACWSILVGAIWFAFLCLATILRRQWADNEKLTFPLAQLPVEMVRAGSEGGPFFRQRLMWIGFAVPTIIHSINGFANIYPSIPSINVNVILNQYFRSPPWDAMPYFAAKFSFAGIGFFYLLPAEITFSFWFFYLLGKLEDVIAISYGVQLRPAAHASVNDYLAYQTSGAFFVLAGYLLWLAWPGVKEALRKPERAGGELLPYRVALGGFAVSLTVATGWAVAMGFSLSFALFEILVYVLVQAVIMARAAAEGGLLMTEGCFTPIDIYGLAGNNAALGPSTLTAMTWTQGMLTRDLRGITVTGFLDGQKVSDSLGLRRRNLLWAFAAGLVGATIISGLIQMWLPYHRGAVTMWDYIYYWAPTQFLREHQPWMQGGSSFVWKGPIFFLIGVLVTIVLGILRIRFSWCPLHPLGYGMSTTWGVVVFWCPMLVAWVLKSLTVHYGGLRLFVKVCPFFLGLIFGELMSAVAWTLAACVWRVQAPIIPFD